MAHVLQEKAQSRAHLLGAETQSPVHLLRGCCRTASDR